MPMFYIRRQDGRAYSTFGWTPDVHSALHYRTESDARAALDKMLGTSGCSVEKVPPKIEPGHTRIERPIFSGGFHGG